MKAKIKNIIFDLGGVILDIEPRAVFDELEKTGLESIDSINSKEFKNLTRKPEIGIITPETFRKRAKALLGFERITDQRFDSIWNAMLLDIPIERIKAIEKVKKHYHIYLMSNTNLIHYDLFVRDLQLRFGYSEFDDLFEKSYFSFAEHMAKPDPDFYEYVLDQHDMKPEETLFIDDTAENIEMAKKFGMYTYLIRRDELVRNLFNNGVLKDGIIPE